MFLKPKTFLDRENAFSCREIFFCRIMAYIQNQNPFMQTLGKDLKSQSKYCGPAVQRPWGGDHGDEAVGRRHEHVPGEAEIQPWRRKQSSAGTRSSPKSSAFFSTFQCWAAPLHFKDNSPCRDRSELDSTPLEDSQMLRAGPMCIFAASR